MSIARQFTFNSHFDACRCQLVTQTGFEKLRNLRLTRLDITRCNGLTDTGLEAFRGLPLTDLRICSCVGVTDQGLRILVEMSLTKLDLSGSDGELTDACLDHIQGMTSLTWLNISRRTKITDAGMGLWGQGFVIDRCRHILGSGVRVCLQPLIIFSIACLLWHWQA